MNSKVNARLRGWHSALEASTPTHRSCRSARTRNQRIARLLGRAEGRRQSLTKAVLPA